MKIMADLIKLGKKLLSEIPNSEFIKLDDIKVKNTERLHKEIDNELYRMLNEVFAWAQHIRIEAIKKKEDGIDDDALIIQEAVENYLHDRGINPREVIEYEKYGVLGKVRYDEGEI
jgi:type III secretion system FlhB-like substrate exporter